MTGKEYVYRVSDAQGNYIGQWTDVVSELTWSQRINTPGTTTVVRLGRSAKRTTETRDTLVDSSGAVLTDSAGEAYVVVSQTTNTIGPDSDCDLNYRVDIYVAYGNFEPLITNVGEGYVTDSGEDYVVATGAPLGRRVFSGIILDYNSVFDDREYVEVTIASNGVELSREVVRSGATTTVSYSSSTHDAIVRSILDTNPGRMNYSAGSIDASGVSISQDFQLNTKLEAIQTVYNQTDTGWYWFGHIGENNVYFKAKGSSADHSFLLGQHIKGIKLKRSGEDIRNTIYFVGGDTGSGILYKKYVDAASVSTYGTRVYRITDRRFTLTTSAQRYASKVMARYSQPIYTTSVEILSEVYDIETIQLGQLVTFDNFGNFIDGLLLQVVSIDYTPHVVTVGLGELLETQQDVVADVTADLKNEQYAKIPTAPN